MIWFKGCPKCGGDLEEERDWYGRSVLCVQCGHELTKGEEVVLLYRDHQLHHMQEAHPDRLVGAAR